MYHRRHQQQQQQQQRAHGASSSSSTSSSSSVDNSLYETLGVARNADDREIKTAFRKLAAIYHPDKKPTGDKEKFQKINHAHEILSNPEKRRIYDLGGLTSVEQQQQRQSANAAHQNATSEMLKRMFGMGSPFSPMGASAAGADDDEENIFGPTGAGPGGMPRMFSFAFGPGSGGAEGMGGPFFMHGNNFGDRNGARSQEPEIRHLCDVSLAQVFAQEPYTFEIDVRKRKAAAAATSSTSSSSAQGSAQGGAEGATIVTERCKFKVTFKSWDDLRRPILLQGKGNQNIDEKVRDGDIVLRTNLLDHEHFVPCNTHDLILRHTISFEDSLCGFDFKVPFIDRNKTELHFSNRDRTDELVQPGTAYKCACGLPRGELSESFVFDPMKTNYDDFGTLFVVLDVDAPEKIDEEQRRRLVARLAAGGAVNRPAAPNLVKLDRAAPRIEMQLAGEMLARKADLRAMKRLQAGE